MTKRNPKPLKIDDVDRLARGRRSGGRIGSRGVAHRLNARERGSYERAMRYGYLTVDQSERDNLWHIWEKVCLARKRDCWVLVREQSRGVIYCNMKRLQSLPLAAAKQRIRQLVGDPA